MRNVLHAPTGASPGLLRSGKSAAPAILLAALLLASQFSGCISGSKDADGANEAFSLTEALALSGETKIKQIEEAVIVPDTDPFYALLGSSAAVRYVGGGNTSDVKPMLVAGSDGAASSFLTRYSPSSVLSLGKAKIDGFTPVEIHGCNPTSCSINLMAHCWEKAPGVMLIPHTKEGYEIGVNAAPLANYLGIPILVIDEKIADGKTECKDALWSNIDSALGAIGAKYAVAIGADGERFAERLKLPPLRISGNFEATCAVAEAVKAKFGKLDYVVMANPSDAFYPTIISSNFSAQNGHIENIQVLVAGEKASVSGAPSQSFKISVPQGIVRLRIYATITSFAAPAATDPAGMVPILHATLYDSKGTYAGFSTSMAYDDKTAFIDTLIVEDPGDYNLDVGIYYGTKGAAVIATPYMAGASAVSADFVVNSTLEVLDSPSIPVVPRLSQVAPYLAAAHQGSVIANPEFMFNDAAYADEANGSCAGPAYNAKLHQYNNMKVDMNIAYVKSVFETLKNKSLLDSYLAGPAYFAMVGDANMLPMYFYSGDGSWPEDGVGLPSDLPYSTLDANSTDVKLSIARTIGWSAEDASTLVARSLFYKRYCGAPSATDAVPWQKKFMFLCGGGGGEFGAVFHQIPYGATAAQNGFVPEYFIDAASGRQATELAGAYANANYFEGIAHGNWYWYVTDLYGPDVYSTSVCVSKVRRWSVQPMVFMTGMCHTGRIDGIPGTEALSQAFVHAGVNAYLGATRATGSESSTAVMEDALILKNMSIGEAFRELKRDQQAPPSFYIRTLYADPAWNPFEPNNEGAS